MSGGSWMAFRGPERRPGGWASVRAHACREQADRHHPDADAAHPGCWSSPRRTSALPRRPRRQSDGDRSPRCHSSRASWRPGRAIRRCAAPVRSRRPEPAPVRSRPARPPQPRTRPSTRHRRSFRRRRRLPPTGSSTGLFTALGPTRPRPRPGRPVIRGGSTTWA